MKRYAGIGFLLFALTGAAHGATCTATTSSPQPRSWNAAATWSCGNVPANNDDVTIPNGATVTLDVNSNRIDVLTINAGGVLQGDNTNKTLTMDGGNAPDISNSGTINFGAGNLATIFLRNDNEWNGAGTWNLSVIDLNNKTLTFTSGATFTINMSGAATPFTDNFGDLTSQSGMTWNFTGTVAQTLPTDSAAVFGNVTVSNTTGVTLGRNMTSSQLLGNLTVAANGILNNGGFSVTLASAKSLSVAAGAQFNLTGTSTMVTVSGGGAKTFNATSTVKYGGANQTVTAETYGNLTLSGSGSKTIASGTTTVAGNLTLASGVTYNGTSNNPTVNLAGNLSNSGTFNSGTGTYTFNGTAAQTLTGVTTFTSMTVNNSAGLNLASDITVTTASAGVLTLTSGNITTGANTLITARACNTPSVSRTSGHVVGNLRKAIPTQASTCTFEIGSGGNYTPVVTVFVAGTGAGNITASTTGTEHGSIAASGIDSAKSVNRYWTLTNGGVTLSAAGFTATFNYINGSPVDFDAIAAPANFMVERWDGTKWFPTTLDATCTSTPGTNLCEQVNGLTATTFGDFAIGEPLAGFNANPGAFNVFETTTAAGSVLGRLFTERLGAGTFAVAIVAVSNNAVNTTPPAAALTVDVIDASPTGGTLTASSNCRTTWTTVIQTQTVPAAVAWVSGRVNVNITAPVQAVRNARIRVTQGANIGCSTDNFAIRPQAFTATSTNATQTNTSGTPAIKTGANFNLTAASAAGYDGTPSIDNTMVVGTPTAGTIGGSFGAAPVATGTAAGASFFYSEVGNFGLNQNAVFDSSFTSVDQPDDCTADFSNTLVGGKYGCSFGSTAIAQTLGASGFGRFIPDNFAVSLNTPQFGTGCGTFTYVGKTFSYAAAPVITVTARNGTNNGLANATTTNYAGAYMKITNAGLTPNTQGGRYSRFDTLGGGATPTLDTAGLPAIAGDPSIGTFTAGAGALTFGSGTGLAFARSTTTPNAPFNADIALALNVIDTDAVAFAGNPAAFGAATSGNGIGFNNGKAMRFGRLRLFNANGSQLIAMPIPMQTQYWNGSGFVTNTLDNCTTLALNNIALGNYQKNLNAGETTATVGGVFNAGIGTLRLSAPGAANNGSVDVAVNLTAATTSASCTAGMTSIAGANLTHLQGAWCGATYVNDPTARATFGSYRNTDKFIYQQENF